jgi:hypothetical protein
MTASAPALSPIAPTAGDALIGSLGAYLRRLLKRKVPPDVVWNSSRQIMLGLATRGYIPVCVSTPDYAREALAPYVPSDKLDEVWDAIWGGALLHVAPVDMKPEDELH